jgi:hypothetical protein
MRTSANLTFFIDDCHVSANISSQGKNSIFTSDKKTRRNISERENLTLTLLKELSKDVRDWSSKPEFLNYEITDFKIIISPSWYISQTSIVTKESPKPIIFAESLILDSAAENLANNPDVFSSSKDLLLIEKEISHVSLNGYPVSSINKQRATLCKASVYYCYMNKLFNNLILDAVKSVNHQAPKITFHSLAKVTSEYTKKSIQDLTILKNGNIVIVNFCSYVTEVLYLHNETNLNVLSLPIGYKETLHSLTEHTNSDHAATESLLDLFMNDKLKPESRDIVLELLHKVGKDWADSVMKGINQLPKTPGPNTKLFVYGIDAGQTEIAKMFSRLLPFQSDQDIPVTLFNHIVI